MNSLKNLFDNNYKALCNYAAVIIKDKHQAEDIVQNVFIQLWENDKIYKLQNPEPYLLKCVRFKCIDYLRGKKRKKEIPLETLPEIGFEQNHSLKEEEIAPLLSYFIAKLPPKMRQVFLMSRQQEMSYKDIASKLDISIKTVENQMGSALKKMRFFLREHNYLPALLIFF